MRKAFKVFCCLAVLVIVQGAQADGIGTVTPTQVTGELGRVGDGITPATMWYDNSTTDFGDGRTYYFPPGDAIVPVELGDDVPFSGTQHVSTLVFAYGTSHIGDDIECILNFYGGLAADDGPDTGSATASLDVTGLPGSPDGSAVGWIVTLDLVGASVDFDWTASTSSSGINENWLTFTYMTTGTGPILATGGGSQDVFWSSKDLGTGMSGSFFYFFGGPPAPEGSFYIQISD
ncbi:MAG TPA: hypothetical protein VGY77_01010 [Gemmataceae bacterium]|jgi:hypothetical protein|nr:hypothetical protein [Gemmataceae bacterium]